MRICAVLFATLFAASPPVLAAPTSCVCGERCTCAAGACPGKCPVAAPEIHVSPDGTVNRRCADGVYRPVAGVGKRTPAPTLAPARRIIGYRQQCVNGTCTLVPVYGP
jgi:hypothetical protein